MSPRVADMVESMKTEELVACLRNMELGVATRAADRLLSLTEENARLREALESIATNTCCDKCQEAALVARTALAKALSPSPATEVK